LNSTPLQLVPVDYGTDYQKKVSEPVRKEEPVTRFDEVLDTAVNKNEAEKSSAPNSPEDGQPDAAAVDSEHNAETVNSEAGQTEKDVQTESSEKGISSDSKKTDKAGKADGRKKTADTKGSEEAGSEDLAAAAAGMAGGGKTEELKNGKLGKKEVGAAAIKIDAKPDAAEILKSAAGQFGAVKPEAVTGKTKEKTLTVQSERAAGKLSSEGAESLLKAVSGSKGEKLQAAASRLMSASVSDEKISHRKDKSKTSGAKLRVVDHRKTSAHKSTGETFKFYSNETTSITGASSDEAGKTIELNAQPDTLRIDGRSAEPKSQQSAVLSQLKEGVNDQIVKQAGIIVKANGSGEIKLVMKPEQLGKVRIQLSLNDNHIAGRIIVENNIVREIFESNLENLYKAFGSEGFENGGLEVTVEGGDAGESGRRSSGGLNRRAVQAIEDAVPEVAETEWQNNAVNMVV
jgi:flagellar hook-length control protein FliK